MRSSELMLLAEEGSIKVGSVFRDQEGNDFVFTGRTFQPIEEPDPERYYGLCTDDVWTMCDYEIELD